MTDVDRFLDRFAGFGRAPDPDKYEDLFDPADGTVLHPGMITPLHRNQVRAYMATYLAGVPEFRFEIVEWAERDGTVFVEARNSGRPGGAEVLEWGTVYCITLRGDRVLRGRAYGDRVPLLARLMPEVTLAQAAALGAPAPGLDVGEGD
ncbi:nuclear transport factor 2 family protein [Mycobacterium sp. M26]|uniref:nuclear transport factor 2 family protein n=1 Tax=Mycobacterium sp. M26 TaxID=1762962 RepID=UPI00073E9D4A|nr:nuclear transport factor 2 family protein [Mycobacterium sp. M26]